MSAAAAQTSQKALPKVLRIGVFREGKPVGERLVRHGESVSFADVDRLVRRGPGGADAGDFLTALNLAPRHELFTAGAQGYTLNLPQSMDGRLQWRDGIRSVEELAGRGEATQRGDAYAVGLTENVKGKLVAGSLTILFQFVPAPPEPVRSINPADFRPRFIDDEDPLFMGLLGVLTVIAGTFMAWVYITPLPEHLDLDDVDAAVDLVVEREIEQVVLPDTSTTGNEPKPDKPEPSEAAQETTTSNADNRPAGDRPTTDSVVKKSLLLQMIGTAGDASGSAVADILGDESASVAKLDAALAGVSGVQEANGSNTGVKTGSGGGRDAAAVGVGIATGGTGSTGSGVAVQVKKPKVGYGDASTDVEEGDAGSIPSLVRKNSARVQTCVEQSLKANPSLNGRVTISFAIAKGRVTESSATSNTTGDDALGQCIARAVRSIRFPDDTTARVEFPYVVSGQ